MLMYFNVKFENHRPIYVQIGEHIEKMINSGMLVEKSKLPSSRELSLLLKVSRNSVMAAYEFLEDKDLVYTVKGKGTFVCETKREVNDKWKIDWNNKFNELALNSEKLDIMKSEKLYKKGMIPFNSIAPDESLFDIEEFKRAFSCRISIEGKKLLNYGYARGYKPLMDYIKKYMKEKGVDIGSKEILITNGFTEGFDLVLSSLTERGDSILCENPTHNTAIKMMKLHGLNLCGVQMDKRGINTEKLKICLKENKVKLAYLIPSYHNPTGIVMPYERRKEVYNLLRQYKVPIIEDGFNEELQYLGTHISPIAAISGKENSVIYIGSLSKILFPGIRIGWILADKRLIEVLESLKRSRNIHTSFLDQAILYDFMNSGSFEKHVRKSRDRYKTKFHLIKEEINKHIPYKEIWGDGGLYLFVELEDIDTRELLDRCYERGVIFTPGSMFFTNDGGKDSLRIGFSRTTESEIIKGIQIIGEEIRYIKMRKR